MGSSEKKRKRPQAPIPGRPVRGSKTGTPLMAALDLIGRRWTLQIVWELSSRPMGFMELKNRCGGITPAVLSQRLKELKETRIIEKGDKNEYSLSSIGADLFLAIGALKSWSKDWATHFTNASNNQI
jgi:DNA-binding HxlR family transcriptional regulator